MGFPPPTDAPTPTEQDAAEAAASFAPSPSGESLCGFAFPGLPAFPPSFNFSFPPDFGFPPAWAFPPLPTLCDLANALGSVAFGGGRVGTLGLEKDPEYETG